VLDPDLKGQLILDSALLSVASLLLNPSAKILRIAEFYVTLT